MVTPLTVDIDADIRGALTYDALNEQIMAVRRALYHDLGVPFPGINLSLNPSLSDGRYRILVNEVPVSEGALLKGRIFALEEEVATQQQIRPLEEFFCSAAKAFHRANASFLLNPYKLIV